MLFFAPEARLSSDTYMTDLTEQIYHNWPVTLFYVRKLTN